MTAATPALERLGTSKYVLLTTYRKDGTPVATPVWVVRDGDALAVWTESGAGKVKRVRRTSRVMVGPCNFRGVPMGQSVPGRAELLDAAGTARVRALLKRKYGVTGWLLVGLSLRRRGPQGTVGIRVTLDD
jgi:uncharacterized protein